VSNFKLFRLSGGTVAEITGGTAQVEKSLQTLFEKSLEPLLGVRFLVSEHKTGAVHGGRIDTLGLDENGCPVIIEFKRAVNENVINQGLFYLDWLMDHRGDFEMLVLNRLGPEALKQVDWSAPRLVCVAADFTNYDQHAVRQINRNIDLVRYRHYGEELLLLQLVHAAAATTPPSSEITSPPSAGGSGATTQDIAQRLEQAPQPVKDVYEALKEYLLALGDDVQLKQLKTYFAFRRTKNFACVFPQGAKLMVYLKGDPQSVNFVPGFTRNVTNTGHYGTGDIEVAFETITDFQKAQPLLMKSYEAS
jgi:predicted transport protein